MLQTKVIFFFPKNFSTKANIEMCFPGQHLMSVSIQCSLYSIQVHPTLGSARISVPSAAWLPFPKWAIPVP